MLDSKYQVVRKLAEGGMAEILLADLADEEGLVRRVVVKRILAEFSKDPAFKSMFLNEAKLVSKFHHPNVVEIVDFGIDDGRYFIAMEYVDGFHLGALNKRCAVMGRPVPYELAARMVSQACQGLGYAHGFTEDGQPLKLIHRDISPENLLINRSGVVKVADFGIAKIEGQVRTTRAGTVKGKLLYMAPEQFRAEAIDHRADIFALGIVLYELCTGNRPFNGEHDGAAMQAMLVGRATPMVAFRPDAPPALQQIIDRALAQDPAERFQSCAEFQAALEKFSSKASPQALAVFVADLAPSEAVTEAKTAVVDLAELPPAAVPSAPPPPAPAPAPAPIPLVDTSRSLFLPPTVKSLPRMDEEPAPSDSVILPPTAPSPVRVRAPDPVPIPSREGLRPIEPSFELEAKAFGRRRGIPKGVWIGAGVVLLAVASFLLGRLGGSPEPVAEEPKPVEKVAAPVEEPKAEAKPDPAPAPPPKVEPKVAKAEPKPAPKAEPKPKSKPKRGRPEAASAPDEWAAPPAASKGINGRVTQRANGYVLANDTDFAWTGCHLRFPNAKAYVVPAPLAPRKQLSVAFTFLQTDAEPTDAYVLQGFAQVRCREGSKYLAIGN